MIVLGCDPGKMVGACVWSEGKMLHQGECDHLEFMGWADQVIPMYAAWDLRVVCEQFDVGPETLTKRADVHWATDVIGALWWACVKAEVPFVRSPRIAKKFGDDLKLKQAGWFLPGKGHANDAARHCLTYLVNQKRFRPDGSDPRARRT